MLALEQSRRTVLASKLTNDLVQRAHDDDCCSDLDNAELPASESRPRRAGSRSRREEVEEDLPVGQEFPRQSRGEHAEQKRIEISCDTASYAAAAKVEALTITRCLDVLALEQSRRTVLASRLTAWFGAGRSYA